MKKVKDSEKLNEESGDGLIPVPTPSESSNYVPLPEKPRLAVAAEGVSTRALNSLPEGAVFPPPVEKTPGPREQLRQAREVAGKKE